MRGRRCINKNGPRVSGKNLPGMQRNLRCRWSAIHCNAIGQKTQHSQAGQQAQTDTVVGSLLPPASRGLMRDVTIYKQREEDVSVRDTRH
jgi:hypothetical protein